jgi:hypothetical protein
LTRLSAAFLAWLAAIAVAAPAARSQPANDPIGALLDRPGRMTPEVDEPDAAGQPVPQEPDPSVRGVPLAPRPYVPPSSRLSEPTQVDETGKSPDGPPTVNDLAYESRIRSSIASAQSFQGPLDGGWTLTSGPAELYALQLVDRGNGALEGAWRDLRRQGALGSSGFVDQIESQGPDLTLRFTMASGASAEAVLHADAAGWSGDLTEGGEHRAVRLRRRAP